jgi:hypothetical protein
MTIEFIQSVQTIGIFVLAAAVIYVVARLERAFEKGAKRIQTVVKHLQEFEARLDRYYLRIEAVENRQVSLTQRLDAIEARFVQRMEAIEKRSGNP